MSSPDVNFPSESDIWLSVPARFRHGVVVGMMLGLTTFSSMTAMGLLGKAVSNLAETVPESLDRSSDQIGDVVGEPVERVVDAAFLTMAVMTVPIGAAALAKRRREGLASEKDVRTALRGLSVIGKAFENGARILPKIELLNRSEATFERLTIDVTLRSEIVGRTPAFQNATVIYDRVEPDCSDETNLLKSEMGFVPTNSEFEAAPAHFPLVDELASHWQARITHPGEPFRNFDEDEVTGVDVRSISAYFGDHHIVADLMPSGRVSNLQIDGKSANYGLEQ